ncbi:hypothetical protein [Dyella sp. 2HG41-7]|uniref:ATP-grasp domain-containing protein n=1 Tax=Dyella sp. 2HG41-7 TaxID=2883239 RepID=UPI001F3A2BEE|nr:hypothetical protein [Dyella sp. 2HG41-7]
MSAPVSEIRLAIASSHEFPNVHVDDVVFVAMLELLDIQPTVCVWNDPAVDWTAFDAVLIRTIWDYFEHYDAYLAWLQTLERQGVTTINDTQTLRWNGDKRYLLDLERIGIPIIPTRVVHGRDLQEASLSLSDRHVVIKPTVSGGAWHTVRGETGTAEFQHALTQLPKEFDYLVQPFVPEVASNGEWSLLYFDGAYSHAVLKRPTTGDYRVQEKHGGTMEQATPDDAILNAAGKTVAAVSALGFRKPAYARVDGVVVGDQFLIMELELIEPSLFLAERPDAAERFARHIAERVQRLAREDAM